MTARMTPTAPHPLLLAAAVIIALAGLYLARSVLEPVAFALFITVLAAPLQARLRRHLPAGLALLLTVAVTLAVVAALGLIVIWAIGDLGRWVAGNIPRFQASYAEANAWLEGHGFYVPGLVAKRFDAGWIIQPLRAAAAGAQNVAGFMMLAFVFIVLGLKEVPELPGRLARLNAVDTLPIAAAIAAKFQRYMAVRGVASLLTGAGTAILAAAIGVEKPLAWGVLAFALNVLPFIGPLIVVVLITLFTAVQFGTWQPPLIVLAGATTVQFIIGSYLEPILAGAALAMSPFLVLFSVFFWALLWGITGAFLGVPIMIMLLTLLERYPSTRWASILFSSRN